MRLCNSTKEILGELIKKKYISNDELSNFFRHQNNNNLKKLIKSQFNFKLDKLIYLRGLLFSSWLDSSDVWAEADIIIFNIILNNGGVMFLSDIYNNCNLAQTKIRKRILGLEEDEKALISIIGKQNNKLVFISREFIDSWLSKSKNIQIKDGK